MVSRLHDFVANTTIASGEVDDELNQIIDELNTNVILTTGAQTKAGVLTLTTPVITQILGSGAGKVYPELTAGKVVCTSNTTTTTAADVTGATVTITPEVACFAIISVTTDMTSSVAGDVCVIALVVDGANQTEQTLFMPPVAAHRATVGQTYVIALTAAAHTIKLQVIRLSGSGTVTAYTTHTGFSYFLISQ